MQSTPDVFRPLVIAALVLVGACKTEQSQTKSEIPEQQAQAEPAQAEQVVPEWHVTAVFIDTGIATLCGMDTTQTYFEYDSAKLSSEAKSKVAELAKCFDEGALSGRDLVLIGRTDPQGTDAYNRELGMSRAESVAQALEQEGMAESRITVESSGEAKAHENPQEWAEDRRVDVQLGD